MTSVLAINLVRYMPFSTLYYCLSGNSCCRAFEVNNVDHLRAMRYFAKVVETGSFTRTAAEFDVPPSSVSRRVADLEKELGATLLKRSTRSVQATEIGQIYFRQAQKILQQFEESEETVRSYQRTPMGQLHINAVVGFGERALLPHLEEFRSLYPEILLDVSITDTPFSPLRDDVDIVIGGGHLPNERVQAVTLMTGDWVLMASPGYLQERGYPETVFDLKDHDGILYRSDYGPMAWLCEIDNEWHDVSPRAIAMTNSMQWHEELVLSGQGLLLAWRMYMADHIATGKIREVQLDRPIHLKLERPFGVNSSDPTSIFLLYQKHRYQIPKIKVAVDYLVAKIRNSAR